MQEDVAPCHAVSISVDYAGSTSGAHDIKSHKIVVNMGDGRDMVIALPPLINGKFSTDFAMIGKTTLPVALANNKERGLHSFTSNSRRRRG